MPMELLMSLNFLYHSACCDIESSSVRQINFSDFLKVVGERMQGFYSSLCYRYTDNNLTLDSFLAYFYFISFFYFFNFYSFSPLRNSLGC